MSLSLVMFRSLWSYRAFVFGAVKREFQLKYRGSMLGILWTVLNPLAMILVFTLIFSTVMKPALPGREGSIFAYSVYLIAGLITWNLFAEVLTRLNGVFIENANILKKANFPRICLPVVVVLSSLVNFGIIAGLYLVFLILTDNLPGWVVLAALPVLVIEIAFALGLGILMGTLNVFFRDVGQFTGVVLQFWFWLTPIVYVPAILPAAVADSLSYNPMWPVIKAFHSIFSEQAVPDWTSLLPTALLSAALLLMGGLVFVRLSGEMVDEL